MESLIGLPQPGSLPTPPNDASREPAHVFLSYSRKDGRTSGRTNPLRRSCVVVIRRYRGDNHASLQDAGPEER